MSGLLGEHFSDAFRGMVLEHGCHETLLVGVVEDQAHLYGILDRIRGLGLDLVSVQPAGGRDDEQ